MSEKPSSGEPFRVADPVMDKTQGRPMVVLGDTGQTVEEWSEENNFDLLDNYGNQKCGVEPDDRVYDCGYVSNVRSEPSKDYAMPESRLVLIDVHHADDGHQLYERVAVDVLDRLFQVALGVDARPSADALENAAYAAGFAPDHVREARELAKAARFGDADAGEEGED